VLPAASVAYLVTRVVRRMSTKVWRATDGRPVVRGIAAVVAASMLAGLLTMWWPHGQYEPIQPHERGTLASLRGTAAWPLAEELTSFVGSSHAPAWASYSAPGDDGSALAVDGASVASTGNEAASSVDADAPGGIEAGGFPFPLPAPPGEGDNQALAVNTTNGSSLIDMALSLIFSTGQDVDNTNEAYALASCIECLTVAIAFQVVVILDADHDVIPENVAAAINVACVTCVTQAVAIQLVVTLSEPLTEAEMAELEALWAELEALEAKIGKLSPDEIYERLAVIQAEIDALLDEAAADDEAASGSELDAPSSDDAAHDTNVTNGSSEALVTEESASPTPSPTASPSESPTPTSSPSPSSSPSSSPSGEPTPAP
jgi:putative peptide zinc metalloprotease protein